MSVRDKDKCGSCYHKTDPGFQGFGDITRKKSNRPETMLGRGRRKHTMLIWNLLIAAWICGARKRSACKTMLMTSKLVNLEESNKEIKSKIPITK